MANEAYKLRGTKQPIAFGVEKLEGYIVDATEDTVEGQELEVENEDGNVVAHFSGFGIKYNRTASVIPLSDASAPSPGDSFKIGEKFEFIVKSVKKSRARKDVEKWDCLERTIQRFRWNRLPNGILLRGVYKLRTQGFRQETKAFLFTPLPLS